MQTYRIRCVSLPPSSSFAAFPSDRNMFVSAAQVHSRHDQVGCLTTSCIPFECSSTTNRRQATGDVDIVSGTRYDSLGRGGVVGWNLRRRIISRGANLLAILALWPDVTDVTGSFRLYKTEVLKTLVQETQSKGVRLFLFPSKCCCSKIDVLGPPDSSFSRWRSLSEHQQKGTRSGKCPSSLWTAWKESPNLEEAR